MAPKQHGDLRPSEKSRDSEVRSARKKCPEHRRSWQIHLAGTRQLGNGLPFTGHGGFRERNVGCATPRLQIQRDQWLMKSDLLILAKRGPTPHQYEASEQQGNGSSVSKYVYSQDRKDHRRCLGKSRADLYRW